MPPTVFVVVDCEMVMSKRLSVHHDKFDSLCIYSNIASPSLSREIFCVAENFNQIWPIFTINPKFMFHILSISEGIEFSPKITIKGKICKRERETRDNRWGEKENGKWPEHYVALTLGSVQRFLPYSIKYLSKGIISSLHLRITLSDFFPPPSPAPFSLWTSGFSLSLSKNENPRVIYCLLILTSLSYWFRFKMSSVLTSLRRLFSVYLSIICL